MKQNRNVVRLTESQLRNMIAESVTNVLNEIGDTDLGQFMLGRAFARQEKYPLANVENASTYASGKAHEYNLSRKAFNDGRENQHALQNRIDTYNSYGDDDQRFKDEKMGEINDVKNDIEQETRKLAYMSLPSYKKQVDDETKAQNAELRNQVRKKYSLNNPMFKKTNESKLNAKIGKIVNESINKILKNK